MTTNISSLVPDFESLQQFELDIRELSIYANVDRRGQIVVVSYRCNGNKAELGTVETYRENALRGGHSHDVLTKGLVLWGEVLLKRTIPETGNEIEERYETGDFFEIPGGSPYLKRGIAPFSVIFSPKFGQTHKPTEYLPYRSQITASLKE